MGATLKHLLAYLITACTVTLSTSTSDNFHLDIQVVIFPFYYVSTYRKEYLFSYPIRLLVLTSTVIHLVTKISTETTCFWNYLRITLIPIKVTIGFNTQQGCLLSLPVVHHTLPMANLHIISHQY